jgi:hypothetical protein
VAHAQLRRCVYVTTLEGVFHRWKGSGQSQLLTQNDEAVGKSGY